MSLYRKYRPRLWDDVVGQHTIVTTLKNQLASGTTAHAYLFSGPRGTGKTTLARLVAKSLNCTGRAQGAAEPCNECALCKDIAAGQCMDVMEIDAASHTGVDNVRENIIESTQFKPVLAKHKVFIIDEVHMLSNAAFNALLKTLEEPPQHVTFILATTEPHKLPATIVSRCQRYHFKRIGAPEMKKRLQEISTREERVVDDVVLERIIQLSEGCMRDAESLLGQCMALGNNHITKETVEQVLPSTYEKVVGDLMTCVLEGDRTRALTLIHEYNNQGVNWPHVVNGLLLYLKHALILNVQGRSDGYIETLDNAKEHEKRIKGTELARLIALADSLIERKGQLALSPIPQLPLELWVTQHALPPAENAHKKNTATSMQESVVEKKTHERQEVEPQTQKRVAESALMQKPPSDNVSQNAVAQPSQENIDDMQKLWHNCATYISQQSPSLGLVLQNTEFAGWNGSHITLSFSYVLHRDRLMEHKTRAMVEDVLHKQFGISAKIEGKVRESAAAVPARKSEARSTLDALGAALGGQVIQ